MKRRPFIFLLCIGFYLNWYSSHVNRLMQYLTFEEYFTLLQDDNGKSFAQALNVVKFHSALFKLIYTRLPKEFIVSFRRCNTCSLSFHGRLFPIHVGVKQLIADLSGGAHISRSLTYLTKEEAYLTKLRVSHKRGTIVLCLHQGHPSLGMTFITSA